MVVQDATSVAKGGQGAWAKFEYYFAQREAKETIVYLYDAILSLPTFLGDRILTENAAKQQKHVSQSD
ncbi:hypothetical protein KKE26_09465 [bacterium]|nr:hypothetical protein [bacterium]